MTNLTNKADSAFTVLLCALLAGLLLIVAILFDKVKEVM